MRFLSKSPSLKGKVILREEIESTVEAKDGFLEGALEVLTDKAGLAPDRALDARLVLDELINNSIVHGNQRDENKKITVTLYSTKRGWAATVEDEGSGFNPEDISTDFDVIELTQTGGRGLALVEMYADNLQYYNDGASAYVRFSVGVRT